jgi:hypothetical protein
MNTGTQIPAKAIDIIKAHGYDGIKELGNKGVDDRNKRQVNWISFESNQIKSAIGNTGEFSPDNDSILKSVVSENGIGFPTRTINAEQRQFAKDVDATIDGTLDWRETPEVLTQAPPLLRRLGLVNKQIHIPQSVIRKAVGNGTKDHNIAPEVVKQLTFELNNPVMVFDSSSDKNALVVLTNLANRDGFPVVAVIKYNGNIGEGVVNVIPSVHEKNQFRFITDWARNNKLRYINKEKSQQWFQQFGVQFSDTETKLLTSPNILTEDDYCQKNK